MIRFDLACAAGHRFDAWFRSGADFDMQAAAGLLACPDCAGTDIAKALMAPSVRTSRAKPAEGEASAESSAAPPGAASPPPARPSVPATASPDAIRAAAHVAAGPGAREAMMRHMMARMHAHVVATAEDMGTGFAAEARRIHEGETEPRGIYGEASRDEVEDLLEDGIAILPLPMPPKADA